MREQIIKSFELIIWAFGGLLILFALISGIGSIASGDFLLGLGSIIGGVLSTIVTLGLVFLVIAIQENTKRTAEAVEKLAER